MSEIWKGIPELDTKYEISNKGMIRSITRKVPCKGGTRILKGKLLKTQVNHRGYSIIALSTMDKKLKTFTVHQLVAMTFKPNFIKGTELNHIDGNKQNNADTNLEISNPTHNQLHAVRNGLVPKVGTSRFNNVTYVKNPRAKKKWAASIRYNGKSSYGWKTFYTEEEAAKHVDSILDSIGDTERNRNFP
jgi:hypothetical protein